MLAAFSVGATVALLVCGCSSSSTAPSLYPSVLADPPPRDDTTMNPDQVKQAVDSLISERNQLCAEAMATDKAGAASTNCAPDNVAGSAPYTGSAAKP